MLLVTSLLSLIIGLVLGTLGGGGAILTLPLLVYVAGAPTRPAIATSLFVVGATSVVGAVIHARARAVVWRVGVLFGAAAMAGAFAGGRLAHYLPAQVLLVAFAAVMLVTAVAMLRKTSVRPAPPANPAAGRALLLGAAVGLVSGVVGAGGGFLIVPALTIFGGLAMRQAVGTSLFVIALQSFAGFAGHVTDVEIDWALVGVVTAPAVIGATAGALLAKKIPAARLRSVFAWLVLGMGFVVLGQQLPLVATAVVAAVTLLLVIALNHRAQLRKSNEPPCTISPRSSL
jgi:uncharacterized membrane protein YfcA